MRTIAALLLVSIAAAVVHADQSYVDMVKADQPVAWWRFEEESAGDIRSEFNAELFAGKRVGSVSQNRKGPAGKAYPLFGAKNRAAFWAGSSYFRVTDPGDKSLLDFQQGDAITIEAWVNSDQLANDRQNYIVGKGRTWRNGEKLENQNYALRIRGIDGTARLSFLFRSAGDKGEYHRWNSTKAMQADGYWHHVAVSYVFGKPESIRGYLDGQPTAGSWDLGGSTSLPPVVDNDELWIGASMGGGNAFEGGIDEVAIFRSVIPPERLKKRYEFHEEFARTPTEPPADLSTEHLTVQVFEGLPAADSWNFAVDEPTETFTQDYAAFLAVPHKYSANGLRVDRSNPFLLRCWLKLEIAEGTQLLMRSKSGARLYADGKKIAESKFMSRNGSGHEKVPALKEGEGLIPPPPAEHHDIKVDIAAGEHTLRWEIIVGGKGLRPEIGRPVLAIARGDTFYFAGGENKSPLAFTDNGWRTYVNHYREFLNRLNDQNRRNNTAGAYWSRRHEFAKNVIQNKGRIEPPAPTKGFPANNAIDHFINKTLAEKEITPSEQTNDYEFARRVSLDTVGVLPTPAQIKSLQSGDTNARQQLIDELLGDPSWADNWVGYWQDVFAENPGILKPKLNNTGPFRYWIHESFRDNKSVDRIATELIMMEGSKYGGGPGGFAMATQNDVPFAAKAHVIGAAFLGVELKCARCHDAPFHTHMQEDLFNMAAMLNRQPIALPKSSTVPTLPGGREPAVEISLAPGQKIEPHWPFEELMSASVPDDLLHKPTDPREQLAAAVTSPHNDRFAKVIVNRLWKRFMGVGFVEPVHDWENGTASHQELLAFLAQELVANDYDLKHVSRLILNSHAYQRRAVHHPSQSEAQLFAAPDRRRMSAEQIIDSLYYAVDKPFRSETLSLDPEGRRPINAFLNLGSPQRAWEFTSLSNERDRPALALPVAQNFVDFLLTFGWRDARPDPLTTREESATVLQSLQMANGLAAARIAQLSDDSVFTDMFCKEQPIESLVESTYLRLLSRPPTKVESEMFVKLLSEGYQDRVVADAVVPSDHGGPRRTAVSWANHLSAEATEIKLQLEQAARQGDRPTARLKADWRTRAEDMIWAIMNSPEFVFMP